MQGSTRRTGLALALGAVALIVASAPAGAESGPAVDERFLEDTYEKLEDELGDRLVDVGIAGGPDRHIALVLDGPAPETTPEVHPELDTRVHRVDGARELTHGPIVPVMLRTSLDVPSAIRPGSWMLEPAPCTLAHVVEDGTGDLYVMTAGHCANTPASRSEDLGRPVEIVTQAGPTGHETLEIGTVLDFLDAGVGADYALIDVYENLEHRVEPSMAGWLGPTGLAEDPSAGTVHHYGFGSAATWTHDATRCRTGYTDGQTGYQGVTSYGFEGVVAFGDSGSPAQTDDGAALGINTHLGLGGAVALGTRASHAVDQLETRNGMDLALVDGAPQAPVCQLV